MAVGLLLLVPAQAQEAPSGNAYDVLGRLFRPFTNVLLSGGKDPERAMELRFRIAAVEGRLPSQFVGAEMRAWVENPDKLRLEAPVFGEVFTVVRQGDQVWATPGDKIEFLLNQFQAKPPPSPKSDTPLSIPITAQQAVFLVALFDVQNRNEAEIEQQGNETFRVIHAGLQQELAKAAGAEDFRATVWIDGGHRPRRLQIFRRDFSTVVDFLQIRFAPTLPPATWEPPADATNIYRTTAAHLEAVLFVVVNSLHTDSNDQPWKNLP